MHDSFLGKTPTPNLLFCILSLLTILVIQTEQTLTRLSVTVNTNESSINTLSTHVWNATYSNSASRTLFTLSFPSCVTISGTTAVTINNLAATVTGFTSSTITVAPAITTAGTSYNFSVSNVRNCFYSATFLIVNNYSIFNNPDNVTEREPNLNQSSVSYSLGTIQNCVIGFDNVTGASASTVSAKFAIQNEIKNLPIFTVRLKYPSQYVSTTYNLLSSTNPQCQLFRNNTRQTNVPATTSSVSTIQLTISCSFNLTNITVPITAADSISVRLNPILNPLTTTSYTTSTGFQITTADGQGNRYDRSLLCQLDAVQLATYSGSFTINQFINLNMFPLQVQSIDSIPMRLSQFDRVLIKYSLGDFTTCTGNLEVDKTLRLSTPVVFTKQVTSFNKALQFISTDSSQGKQRMFIQFKDCIFLMTPSTTPIQFTFLFSAPDSNSNYASYMQINATLTPKHTVMSSSQVALSVSVATIGDESDYTFTITTKQPLSSTPSVIITFPVDINITAANQTLQSCTVTLNTTGIGTKQFQILNSTTILVNFTTSSDIPINTNIIITVLKVRNPQRPEKVSGFNITTVYISTQPQGYVQRGFDLIKNQSYAARTIYPTIVNANNSNSFFVYTPNSLFRIRYITGVNLYTNFTIKLTFSNQITSIQSSGLTSGLSLVSQTGNQFIFNITNNYLSGNQFVIDFNGLTPNRTGTFQVVQIQTLNQTQKYESTQSPVMMTVDKPFVVTTFKIAPLVSITGVTTNYTIQFSTTVPHPANSKLWIRFPNTTNFINGAAVCSFGCNITNITDISSGLVDTIQVQLKQVVSGTIYQIIITNITNQRQRSTTPLFQFLTMTLSNQQIISGTASALILSANVLTAEFDAIDDYYRNNTNLVHIQVNVTNLLQVGDYIVFNFTSSSYTANPAYTGGIGCTLGTCTSQKIGSILRVWVKLVSIQVIQKSIDIQLFGLISNPSTLYNITIPISVYTVASLTNNTIDQGTLLYSLDCGQNDTVRNRNCKTCQNGFCTSCYSPTYLLFNNTLCTNNCGDLTKFQTFSGSSVCQACVAPCYSCLDIQNCTSCITGFFKIQGVNRCESSCNTSNGMYRITSNNLSYCNYCPEPNCVSCQNAGICDACNTSWILSSTAKCVGGCPDGYYIAGSKCAKCDVSCLTCSFIGNNNCKICNIGYFNFSGRCINTCPEGTVSLTSGVCGCEGDCDKCVNTSTKCLSCKDPTFYFYKYVCYNNSCPVATYPIGQQCMDCRSGCVKCSSTTCIQCQQNHSIYQNICYLDCKALGQRFSSMNIDLVDKCVECPDGCSQCNQLYQCSACLTGYQLLNSTVCKRECELTNTCSDLPYVDPIIPLPGFITFALWTIIIILLKIFILKNIDVPYTLLFGGALVSYLLVVITLASTDMKIKSLSTARLLQQTISQKLMIPLGLLAVSLALNYIMNIIFIYIFCKYIKSQILQRQIDRISNYVVLVFSLLTSYRFYLMAYSRLFKKPYVEVSGPEKLKILHIFMAVSYVLDLEAFVAGILLVVNSLKLSILFMLGLDLILVIVLLWIVFIYMLVKPKPQEYYSNTKKFSINEQYITEQGSLNNEKQISKGKLKVDGSNQKLQVQQFNGDEQNKDQLPTMQQNVFKIARKKSETAGDGRGEDEDMDVDEEGSNPKTRRKQKGTARGQTGINTHGLNYQINNSSSEKKIDPYIANNNSNRQKHSVIRYEHPNANPKYNKNKGSNSYRSNQQYDEDNTNDNTKIAKKSNHKNNNARMNSQSVINKNKPLKIKTERQQQLQQYQNEDRPVQSGQHPQSMSMATKQKANTMRSTKYAQPQRSSTMRMQQAAQSMKKKKNFASFQSELADSNIDEVDLEAIIQTKVVDRSKVKEKGGDVHSEADRNQKEYQYEQISPSWFNIQNQRYDVEDKDADGDIQ